MKRIDKIQWVAGLIGFLLLAWVSFHTYEETKELSKKQIKQQEIAQIVIDEGFRACKYKDSLGYYTIGFGHLVLKGEVRDTCITPREAIVLLRKDYDQAQASVSRLYPWAESETRLILINMTYQLGAKKLNLFPKFLDASKEGDHDEAAVEMLDSRWAKQAPARAQRLAGRMLGLKK